MKTTAVLMVLSIMVSATLAAYTMCENTRNKSRCVAAAQGSTCPPCPAGRVPLACSSLGNGFEGYQMCATAKRNNNKRLNEEQCAAALESVCDAEDIDTVQGICKSIFDPDWNPEASCDEFGLPYTGESEQYLQTAVAVCSPVQ